MTLNWDAYWGERTTSSAAGVDELLIQVGKTRFGVPVEPDQVAMLVGHVADTLQLDPTCNALDLGCGNGVVTAQLAPRVRRVVGLDYSPAMLETARACNAGPTVEYRRVDLRDPSGTQLPAARYDVAWSVEVVQNLEPTDLSRLLRWLAATMAGGFRFLASGIPDRERIRGFYNTAERWQLHLENEAAGREAMGRWWTRDEIAEVAAQTGTTVEIHALPGGYYTSHYRFDALFRDAR